MRRRWVITTVAATALVFLLAGTAIGHYTIPDKSVSAECVVLKGDLQKLTYIGVSRDNVQRGGPNLASGDILDMYNSNCR